MEIAADLIIYYGFILHLSDDGQHGKLANRLDDPSKIHKEKIQLPQDITLSELRDLIVDRSNSAFGIDLREYNTDRGGKGIMWQLSCTVDVDDAKSEHLLTHLNVPNEGSWEVAKQLMGIAKGDVKLKFLFAVGKAPFLERALLRMFLP